MSGISLIIPAAGRSTRFGGHENKLLMSINGRTILQWTILAFEKIDHIREVILIYGPATRQAILREVESPVCAWTRFKVVEGGARRQDSVKNGLAAVADDCNIIMIHDAARPFIHRDIIMRAIEAADKHGAASVGIPSQDAIKRVRDGNIVEATEDRGGLWLTQTPQVFRREILLAAFRHAEEKRLDGNDDAELVEQMGGRVIMVAGSACNIKITTKDDFSLAEGIARFF